MNYKAIDAGATAFVKVDVPGRMGRAPLTISPTPERSRAGRSS